MSTSDERPEAGAPETQPVKTELREGVGIISLDRPRVHNALDDAARAALSAAFRWAREDEAVRAVLLRGEGRSFCSGRDRGGRFLQPAEHSSHLALIEAAQKVRLGQLGIGKPVIGALQGHVIGAGAELAIGCDMRIAADDMKLSFPEVGFGVVADTGSSTLLTALVGPARAKWLLLSGERIGAEEALAWGLVEWVVPRDALDARAFELAQLLARQPPRAMARQKALIDVQFETEIRRGLEREMLTQLGLFEGEEFARLQRSKS
jgi:enoyl-CoA hydratase/carnithine racemase